MWLCSVDAPNLPDCEGGLEWVRMVPVIMMLKTPANIKPNGAGDYDTKDISKHKASKKLPARADVKRRQVDTYF